MSYALIEETGNSFSCVAALEDINAPATPVHRYVVKINRQSREISTPEPIVLSETELSEAILAATGQHVASSTRFTDGALSVSYRVAVQELQDVEYVVQLRHHGYVASTLPIPPVIPSEHDVVLSDRLHLGARAYNRITGAAVFTDPYEINLSTSTSSFILQITIL